MTTRRTLISLAAGLALLWSGAAAAQTDKSPIRLLVGLSPGGTVDVAARLVAERMSAELGRPVLVDNKPGAGQRLALGEVRRAAPDGRTLLLSPDHTMVMLPLTVKVKPERAGVEAFSVFRAFLNAVAKLFVTMNWALVAAELSGVT